MNQKRKQNLVGMVYKKKNKKFSKNKDNTLKRDLQVKHTENEKAANYICWFTYNPYIQYKKGEKRIEHKGKTNG